MNDELSSDPGAAGRTATNPAAAASPNVLFRSVPDDGAIGGRTRADRLRALRDRVNRIGKRSVADLFDLGEAFEEAADLLRGRFSAWLQQECRIEPRTVLGYRKAHRVLGAQREFLIERGVSPTAVVTLASAPEAVRQHALAMIRSGRNVSVQDVRGLARGEANPRPGPPPLAKAVRAAAPRFLADIERLCSALRSFASSDWASGEGVAELVALAGRLDVAAGYLLSFPPGNETCPDERLQGFAAALAALASVAEPESAAAAAARVISAYDALGVAPAPEADPRPEVDCVHATVIALPGHDLLRTSAFTHGLTAFELCAGAGGQALGLAKAGFHHTGLLERNAAACRTLRTAFPGANVIEADLRAFVPGEYEGVDLLAGGVPCQPFSGSGEMRGPADARDLFPEALRLVDSMRPRALMLENVARILAGRFDSYRLEILDRLRRIGYSAEWRTLNAADFGVPQRRVRAILVAFREPMHMSRFVWPTSFGNYGVEPHTVGAAIDGQVRSRGWTPSEEWRVRVERTAPTVIGGSEEKQSADFGKRNSAAVWGEMGFVQTRIGVSAPEPDHQGLIEATNAMLAAIQGFPAGWPFQGGKQRAFKQVANAFPPPVAMHLGCAIASALTGKAYVPEQQYRLDGMRWIQNPQAVGKRAARRRAEAVTTPAVARRARSGSSGLLPLGALGKAADVGQPDDGPPADW